MELKGLTVFQAVTKRLDWLGQRQEILAQNIANSDTPDYRAKDLRPYQFREVLRRESAQLNMDVTDGQHIGGQRKRIRDFMEETPRKPYETETNGNGVIIEEQMAKVSEVQVHHRMTTELYKKHLSMMRLAVSSR